MHILTRQLHLHSGDTYCAAWNGALGKYGVKLYAKKLADRQKYSIKWRHVAVVAFKLHRYFRLLFWKVMIDNKWTFNVKDTIFNFHLLQYSFFHITDINNNVQGTVLKIKYERFLVCLIHILLSRKDSSMFLKILFASISDILHLSLQNKLSRSSTLSGVLKKFPNDTWCVAGDYNLSNIEWFRENNYYLRCTLVRGTTYVFTFLWNLIIPSIPIADITTIDGTVDKNCN